RTGERFIWLRSTGSTIVSQIIDSFVVLYIGFVVPGKFTYAQWWETGWVNYGLKLVIALGLTPLIYLSHYLVKKYLGDKDAEQQIRHTAEESLKQSVES
ncbi:MAG: queuosine precursor transporter, partial [Bacteroidia bacterium]